MAHDKKTWTLSELAQILGGTVLQSPDFVVHRPVPADSEDATGLTFAGDEKHLAIAAGSGAGAVLVPDSLTEFSKPAIAHKNPRQAFGMFLAMCARDLPLEPGIHPTAVISPDAMVDPTAQIGAYVVIEAKAEVGPGCKIYPFAYIGDGSRLGAKVKVFPHAVILQDVEIGDGSIIGPGSVVGYDGFGFVWNGTKQQKVPQVGGVILGADVELGALTTVDRATAGETLIGEGTKLDNLVQIAHNVRVGKHGVIASFVGVSGSTHIGDRFTAAGQAGISGHIRIGDGVTLAGRGGATGDIPEPGVYGGFPAVPLGQSLRALTVAKNLPELQKRIRDLEKRLEKLEKNS